MLTERGRKRASRGPGSSKDIQLGFQSRLWRKGTFVISPKYGKINKLFWTIMIFDLELN